MKFNYMTTVALVLAAAGNTATAFTPVSPSIATTTRQYQQRFNGKQLLQRQMADKPVDDEIAKLKEAAAQARAEAARLAKVCTVSIGASLYSMYNVRRMKEQPLT